MAEAPRRTGTDASDPHEPETDGLEPTADPPDDRSDVRFDDPFADTELDAAEAHESDDAHAPPRPVDRFRRTSAGTVLAASLLGLRDALEGRPQSEDIEIVGTAPAAGDDRYEMHLDPEHPERSVVVVHQPPKGDTTS